MSSSTTHFNHRIYCLSPSSGDLLPPSPDDLVLIEFHFEEIIGCSASHEVKHRVTKAVTRIPLCALCNATREEHGPRLVSMSLCLSDLGVPEQIHPKIIADTCHMVNSIVAESAATPPMIVVNVSAFSWALRVLDSGFLVAFPDPSSLADLGFCC